MQDLFALCAQKLASDLHLTQGEPPLLRIDGKLARTALPPLSRNALFDLIRSIMTAEQWEFFQQTLEFDFSFAPPGMEDRFRINVHQQRGAVEAACRRVPKHIPSFEELGLPSIVLDLIRKRTGLVLVTGSTGMGKTTTLASMVDLINRERECMIVSIEDPIEFVHTNKHSVVKQREVGADTHSFARGLRCVLRQDPDVIVIGEMRDLETIATALTAAETGHLVLATLHTPNAAQSVERLIDVFPPHQQSQVRLQVANSLQGIIAQLLLPRAFGQGRVLATEIMVVTPGVRNLIREHQFQQIDSLIQTGSQHGMQTMDRTLRDLYRNQLVTEREVVAHVRDLDYFKLCA